jgi:peroxiredoxin
MKHFFTQVLAVAFLSANALAGNPEGYSIKITAKGLKPEGMCQLARYYGDKQYIMDSAKVNEKGEVLFKGKEKWAQGIYMFVPPGKNRYFDFVMDEGQNFSIETDTADFIKTMKVKGSDENKFFYEYQNFMAGKQKENMPLQASYKRLKDKNKDSAKIVADKIAEIDKAVKQYKENFIKSNPKTFVAKLFRAMDEPEIPEAPLLPNGKKDTTFAYHYFKTHYFDNFDLTDDRLLRSPIFHNKIKFYMDKLTPQIPDSIDISADYLVEKARPNQEVFKYLVYWLTYTYESSKIMGMDAVFVHMVKQYYVTKQAFWMDSTQEYKIIKRMHELEPLLIGKKAPAINMPDSTGKYISLYDVKSKYTVVVFWDHGCGHCKKEIPKLLEAYTNKLKAKGVQVYAVETEDKPEDWKKFIRDYKLNWINVQELDDYKRAVTKKIYDIYSTPVIYLLDENKIIKAKRIESEQLENLIDILDKEKEQQKNK